MALYNRILLASDFSPSAEEALRCAAYLARRYGAQIHAIHVTAPYDDREDQIKEELLQAVPGTFDDVVKERAQVRAVSPEIGVLDAAAARQCDLIVMGTHGHTGFAHVLLGSVAERVVQLAPCAVLTCRHPDHQYEHPQPSTVAGQEG